MAKKLAYQQKIQLQREAARLFSPRTPIAVADLFSGRFDQVLKLNATISQPGAHAIIYGERGVGKTSLANVAPITYSLEAKESLHRIVAPRIACDSTDSFDSLWRKVFGGIRITSASQPVGYVTGRVDDEIHPLVEDLQPNSLAPSDVLSVLNDLGKICSLVVTLDEFDRLPKGDVPLLVADTIKALSDNNVSATIVIVGVGDSIAELVRGHESIGRHIVEIPLPRMSREELEKIVEDRLPKLGMTIERSALKLISLVCAGLPYYTHLLGQHAVCKTIFDDKTNVAKEDVNAAMKKAIEDSEREMKAAYYEATHSRQPNTFFSSTLAACALTTHDEFGYFTAASVRQPLGTIRGTPTDIPDFSSHLERFCKKEKGAILQQIGQKHQRRYRFRDPLMQPFVIIRSLDDRIITEEHIKTFAS